MEQTVNTHTHLLIRAVLAVAALLAAGCSDPSEPAPADGASAHRTSDAAALRIVSLVPSLTEMVVALGASDRLVGIGRFDTDVPGRADLPRVGDAHSVSVETVAALRADLVLVNGEELEARLAPVAAGAAGARVEVLRTDDLAQVFASVTRLAELTGREAAGAALTARLRLALDSARDRATKRARERPANSAAPLVLVVVQRRPVYTAGAGSFVHELLGVVGAENAAGDLEQAWPVLAEESLVARRPTVILDASAGDTDTPEGRAALLRDWQRFPAIPAVRDGRVLVLGRESDAIFRAGPRLPEAIALLERLLFEEGEQPR